MTETGSKLKCVHPKIALALALCLAGCSAAWGQAKGQDQDQSAITGKRSVQAPQDPREPALLATCKNPPPPRTPSGFHPQPPQPPRAYTVMGIPGVIAPGEKWKFIWQAMGNNGDGILGTADGGLLLAQNDNSQVVKLDKNGHPSVIYTGTNTGGALSMNSAGDLFLVERGLHESVVELAPQHKVIVDKYKGDPLDCTGGALNDLSADSRGGIYFNLTSPGVYYVNKAGQVTKYADDLRTDAIILSPDEKTLYVADGMKVYALDVHSDGSLGNERQIATLQGSGLGDGSTVDSQGRVYLTTGLGVQVIAPDGKYLGLIPTPRGVISTAFGGPEKKTLYILARGAEDPQGKEVANAAQIYSIRTLAQGYSKRAK